MEPESYLQSRFADRIGGPAFGKDTTIYKFEKIKRAKRAALQANPSLPIIDMGVGEPDDMAAPAVVSTLAAEAAKWENRQYTDNGIAEFKEAAARYMREVFGVEVNPEDEVNHAIGSKSALAMLPACFVNPGDAVVMTTPGYPVMGTWTKYFGGEVVSLRLTESNGFLPDFDAVPAGIRPRIKLVYLNYPNNPTGAVATMAFYEKAVRFARQCGALVVSDAAYAPLTYGARPLSVLAAPGAMECAIELQSMSKGFNMTGWRMSWVCGNKLAVKAFATVKDNADSGQFAAIQKASIKALESHASITTAINEKYERRLRRLVDCLRRLGFPARMPQGGFYLYVKAPCAVAGGPAFRSAEDFTQWLIAEKHVSAVPWDDVGAYVRFSATFVARGGPAEEEAVLAEFERRLASSSFAFA